MYGIRVDCSITNVPTTFDETTGSKIGTDLPACSRLDIQNGSDTAIAFTIADYNSAPSSSITGQLFCSAGGTFSLDQIHISNRSTLYIRSDGAAITTGVIYFNMWGRR